MGGTADPHGEPARIKHRSLMLVLSSPSGDGKTTLSHRLLEVDPGIELSISVTTRRPRRDEVEGRDYHFINAARFDAMVAGGELLEWAMVFGNWYGTPRGAVHAALAVGRDVLFNIDWQGTQQMRMKARADLVSIFLLPPSMAALEEQLRRAHAQDTEDVIRRRMAVVADEIDHQTEYDYVVVNNDIDVAFADVRAILSAERLKRERQIALTAIAPSRSLTLDEAHSESDLSEPARTGTESDNRQLSRQSKSRRTNPKATARTNVGKAVLSNHGEILLSIGSVLIHVDSELARLRDQRPNSPEEIAASASAIKAYEGLKVRLETLRRATVQFPACDVKETVVVASAKSFKQYLAEWWARDHTLICGGAAQTAVFTAALAICSLAGSGGPMTAAVVGAIVTRASVVEALKAVSKSITPILPGTTRKKRG